jgi:DNA-binding transcriptional LysR family regulator
VATLLVPQLWRVFQRHPGLSVELVVGDRFGDPVEERLDPALQRAQPGDSALAARAIGVFGWVLVAAPAYLERHDARRRSSTSLSTVA